MKLGYYINIHYDEIKHSTIIKMLIQIYDNILSITIIKNAM